MSDVSASFPRFVWADGSVAVKEAVPLSEGHRFESTT